MNILITGGSGFIGQALCSYLLKEDHHIFVLTRSIKKASTQLPKAVTLVESLSPELISQMDAVINLAGAPIARRWTARVKQELMSSRLDLTKNIIRLLADASKKPKVFISGSAIGFYGPQGDIPLTESSNGTDSFSHELCAQWENCANEANTLGIRTCLLRTGIVLGAHGGALSQMRPQFILGIGGVIGNGKQWMSWIHIHDMIKIIAFCLTNEKLQGPINATSPFAVTNSEFSNTYAQILHRPCLFKIPSLFIKLIFGQMGYELLLTGQRVIPRKLEDMGFSFSFPKLRDALIQIETSRSKE